MNLRDCPDARLLTALEAALAAGRIAMDGWMADHIKTVQKSDGSLVTPFDPASEDCIREAVRAAYARDAFLGEERGETPGDSGTRWIVDPIDGTSMYARRMPTWGVLIGVEQEGVPVGGVAYMPAMAEICCAWQDFGCWHGRAVEAGAGARDLAPRLTRTRIAAVSRLEDCFGITCTLKSWHKVGRASGIERVRSNMKRLQMGGFNCFDYVLLATGRIDVALDPVMKSWDLAALAPMVREAGGRFTDLDGNETIHGGHSLAASEALHQSVLSLLRE